MDIKVTEIPPQEDRLSSMVRFFETQYEDKKSTRKENRSLYCILKDTTTKTFTLSSTWIYVFDNMVEYWWFTLVSNEVNIPKDWIYYIGAMINTYQIHVPEIKIECKWLSSSSVLSSANDNYWFSTLWFGNIFQLAKNEKISITYTISAWSWFSPNQAYTVWDSNKLFIFELPNLAIS